MKDTFHNAQYLFVVQILTPSNEALTEKCVHHRRFGRSRAVFISDPSMRAIFPYNRGGVDYGGEQLIVESASSSYGRFASGARSTLLTSARASPQDCGKYSTGHRC